MPMSDISSGRTPLRPLRSRSARPPGLAGWRRRGPGDRAAGVHGVQVMRQRGLARSYRLGEFPLVGGLRIFKLSRISQTGRVPPASPRASSNARSTAGRLAQAEPDREENGAGTSASILPSIDI
jgi:hypothetical protein